MLTTILISVAAALLVGLIIFFSIAEPIPPEDTPERRANYKACAEVTMRMHCDPEVNPYAALAYKDVAEGNVDFPSCLVVAGERYRKKPDLKIVA